MTVSGFLAVLWLLPALLARPSSTLTPPQQVDLLRQGNHAFDQALTSTDVYEAQGYYQQAINAYERLIASGVQNAKLYYNLGNAYFRLEDLGRAIVNYRRGLRLEPHNARLQANLRYARSLRTDQFETSHQRSLWRQLLFWHDDLSIATQATLALVGFVVAWGCALIRLLWPHPALRWTLLSAAILCMLFAASSLVFHDRYAATRHGVIVADEAPVRKGNGASYALQLSQPLHPGAEFVVLEERGPWLHVRIENGTRGWIQQAYAVLW